MRVEWDRTYHSYLKLIIAASDIHKLLTHSYADDAAPEALQDPDSDYDKSGAKASIIAMANNTLPLAQLVCGLFAGVFVQQFVDPSSDSVEQTVVQGHAVRYLFIWGGLVFGGLEIILLLLMQCTHKSP